MLLMCSPRLSAIAPRHSAAITPIATQRTCERNFTVRVYLMRARPGAIRRATPHRTLRERMSTVFLTGASGFMGSRLAAELLRRGHRVRALVRPGRDSRAPAGVDL